MSESQDFVGAADDLARLVHQITEDRQAVDLNDLASAAERYWRTRGNAPPAMLGSQSPFTAIETEVDRAAWVLRRLVSLLGFQATLRVFGGDYEERGTNIERGVRINVLRRAFETEHIAALTEFANNHGCDLEFTQEHGATLRLQPIIEAEVSDGKKGVWITGSHEGSSVSIGGAGTDRVVISGNPPG